VRRFIAGVLLLLFVGQSSGVAVAATSNPSGGGVNLLAALVEPARSAIVGSKLFALATGTGSRYEATHAPIPAIVERTTNLNAARIMRAVHPLHPQIREGVRRTVIMPPRSELDPHHHRLDPLAMRRSQLEPTTTPTSAPPGFLEPLHSLTLPQNTRRPVGAAPQRGGVKRLTSSTPGTGIQHWWTYEERAIPGIGKAMVNVGTGNFIVSAMDVDVHEQGIDLAFQRVYNSQSLHDYNSDDGGDPAIFGNRWTNNFDANIVYSSTANTITVYDLDGAACTYSSDGQGHWIPCTGEYATLVPTDQTDCTYAWTKKSGTIYWFHSDNPSGCNIKQAQHGHLQQILGRNYNNNITFAYSYNGTGYSAEDITEIDAIHSDGHELVMKFGIIPGTSINELTKIIRPDLAVLQYSYNINGDLVEVDKPGNNSANTVPTGHGVPQGDVPEAYAYVSGTSTMKEACGPRCTVAIWNHPDNPNDGAAMLFTADSSQRLTIWQINGVLNFTPDDGTSTVLQSGPTTFQQWFLANFVYGSGSACSNTSAGTTTMCDTDGHATVWTPGVGNRVTQTQESTGPGEGLMIVSQAVWSPNNDLTQTIDANGNVTKYAYDTPGYNQGGNLVEMQLPQVTDVGGNPSPLSYYSYDQYNNVTAYCDPVYNQTNGNSWVNSPGDTLCPSNTGAARFSFTQESNEPYGCLSTMKKPGGYTTMISYPSTPGVCGYGLPTQTEGQTITQYDNSTRTPTQNFTHDGYGNLIGYDKGKDSQQRALDSWTLGYDPENQLVQKTENDASIPLTGSSFSCYYPDGSLLYTETPSQHAADGNHNCTSTPPANATAYFYDLDGDQVKVISHKGCSDNNHCQVASPTTACVTNESNPPGTTCKYYDGLDRLVETIEPYDSRKYNPNFPFEFYSFRWMNRYIYDLSQSGGSANLSIADNTGSVSGLVAFGNLYKTQEYLPTTKIQALGQNVGSAGWYDVRGTSFDGLDRPIGKYELAYGTTAVTTNTYDCTGQLDLLCSTRNALGQKTSYTYDTIRRVQAVTFSGTAPLADDRTYTFDADGRTASASAANSMGTLSYTYDKDGNELSVTEPSQKPDPPNGASLICYWPYGDGLREYLSIGLPGDSCGSIPQRRNPSNGGISQNNLFRYSYQLDGLLATQQVNWLGNQETFSWTYAPSGREVKEIDPLTGGKAYFPSQVGGQTVTLVAKTYGYDHYGRVSQLTFPQSSLLSNYAYDIDDELASYQVGSVTRNFVLNARGELLQDYLSNTIFGYAQGPTYSANGAQVGNGDGTGTGGKIEAPPTTLQFDSRTNMATCSPNPQWAQGLLTGDQNYQYDAAGRQVLAGPSANNGGCDPSSAIKPTTYDAENHIQTTQNPWALGNPGAGTGTVLWGPDGRHRVDTNSGGGGTTTQTAHWDGDTLLFQASNPGTPFLYIGKLAVMDPSGDILVADRDQSGTQMMSHVYTAGAPIWSPSGLWYNALNVGSVRHAYLMKNGQPFTVQLTTGSCDLTDSHGNTYPCPTTFATTFPMTRSDGYGMIGGIVQGERTYDPTSGQWLTPDAYAGDAHDPMSQKPFMWNNNNPVAWSDPSGYDPFIVFDPNAAVGFGHIEIAVIDARTGKGTLWSQGPAHNNHLSDRQVITRQSVTIGDIRRMQAGGNTVLTEHTSPSQDRAMNATAQQRYSNQSQGHYNALNFRAGTNCDQFVKQVLGASDPSRASQMSGLDPRADMVNLLKNGIPLMGDDPNRGQNPNAPQQSTPPQGPEKTY
jgi:RHS repeat-associated protein